MADVSELRPTSAPPVMIAYVPEITLPLKLYSNHCHSIMGATGSGKSSVGSVCLAIMTRNSPDRLQFINKASGSHLVVGKGLESRTAEVVLADVFNLDGRRVLLIDSPGFDDTTQSDTEILKLIAAFLTTS